MTHTEEELWDIIQDNNEEWKRISHKTTGQGRWQTHFSDVFCKLNPPEQKGTDTYLQINYARGSTEMQDGSEDIEDSYYVEPKTVEVIKYVRKQ